MTIDQLIENTERLDFNTVLVEAVDETEAELIRIQQEQLYAGQRADGNRIVPEYKDLTVDYKIKRGQPFDRVTLKDKGDFYKGIYVVAYKGGVEIDSTDNKTGLLKDKYGTDIFGLNLMSGLKYSKVIEPIALNKIREQILK